MKEAAEKLDLVLFPSAVLLVLLAPSDFISFFVLALLLVAACLWVCS